ncbi:MAG TPA: PDZ domain-containing protein, partial [Mycobacterium sp.]|nr:PDZ domain-containing protein [Mycobacterium sp.]
TPADQAGVRRGDILVSLGGQNIDSATALTRAIDRHHPGDTVELRWRSPASGDRSANVTLAVGPAG